MSIRRRRMRTQARTRTPSAPQSGPVRPGRPDPPGHRPPAAADTETCACDFRRGCDVVQRPCRTSARPQAQRGHLERRGSGLLRLAPTRRRLGAIARDSAGGFVSAAPAGQRRPDRPPRRGGRSSTPGLLGRTVCAPLSQKRVYPATRARVVRAGPVRSCCLWRVGDGEWSHRGPGTLRSAAGVDGGAGLHCTPRSDGLGKRIEDIFARALLLASFAWAARTVRRGRLTAVLSGSLDPMDGARTNGRVLRVLPDRIPFTSSTTGRGT